MKIGTKSLLFGCHQFVLHPVFTYIAWKKLYDKFPSIGETVAIIIHDWGYFNKSNLDGEEGEKHPEWACKFFYNMKFSYNKKTKIYYKINWYKYRLYLSELCLYHSRFYAEKYNEKPSKLCWADKYGTILYGKYLWLMLATLSGELKEYKANNKYEIDHTDDKHDINDYKYFTEYAKVIKPVIYENVEKIKRDE